MDGSALRCQSSQDQHTETVHTESQGKVQDAVTMRCEAWGSHQHNAYGNMESHVSGVNPTGRGKVCPTQ